MLFSLPPDLFTSVLYECAPNTIGKLLCTSKAFIQYTDEQFWQMYCYKLYTPEFWIRAECESHADPYISMYHEFQRLKQFEYSQYPAIWKCEDYYSWWKLCKKSKVT